MSLFVFCGVYPCDVEALCSQLNRWRNLPSFNGNKKKGVRNFSKMATAMTGTTRIEYFYFIFFLEVRC
jgi:hypothetical protein